MKTPMREITWRGVIFLLLLFVSSVDAQTDSPLGCLKIYGDYSPLYRIFNLDQEQFTDSLPFDAHVDARHIMVSPDGKHLSYLRYVPEESSGDTSDTEEDYFSRYSLVTADVLHPTEATVLYESLPYPNGGGFLPSDFDNLFQAYWLPDSQRILHRWLDDPPRQMLGLANAETGDTIGIEVQMPNGASNFKIDGIAASGDYFSTTYFTPDGYRLRFWRTADLEPLTDDIPVFSNACRLKVEYVNGRQYYGSSYCTYWTMQGSRVAYGMLDYNVPEGEAGDVWIVLVDLSTGEEKRFRPSHGRPDSAYIVAWSPDGESIAFTEIERPDYVADVSITGFNRPQYAKLVNVAVDFDVKDEVVSADIWPELRWSADSKMVAYWMILEDGTRHFQVEVFEEGLNQFSDGFQPQIWEEDDMVIAGFVDPLSGEKQVVGSVSKPADDDWRSKRWIRTAPNGLVVYRLGPTFLWSQPDGSQSGQLTSDLDMQDFIVGVIYDFSPDSRWLIRYKLVDFETDYGGGPVYVFDLQEGRYFVVEAPEGSTISVPIFSPDSRHIAQWLKTGTPENTLRIVSLADMQNHDYPFDLNLAGSLVWVNDETLALGYIVSENSVWVDSGLMVINTQGEILRNIEHLSTSSGFESSPCP